jgi:hypothetical protein
MDRTAKLELYEQEMDSSYRAVTVGCMKFDIFI